MGFGIRESKHAKQANMNFTWAHFLLPQDNGMEMRWGMKRKMFPNIMLSNGITCYKQWGDVYLDESKVVGQMTEFVVCVKLKKAVSPAIISNFYCY